jgi:Calcineurin-like phosphoesterase
MRLRLLLTADLHLSDNPRDTYRHEFVRKQLPKLLRKHGIEKLVILGDLTDEKDRHCARLVNQIVNYLYELDSICPVVILLGNHDYLDRKYPFFRFLQGGQITWIDRPTEQPEGLYLPHTTDWQKDWSELNLQDRTVFTHNTFTGCDMGHGMAGRGIPTTAVQSCTTVYSGDIHIPQKFHNIVYVGAPYQIDFGDDYTPRVLVIDSGTVKTITVGGPMKVLLDGTMEQFLQQLTTVEPGDLVKVRVRLTPEQVPKWNEIRDSIRIGLLERQVAFSSIHPIAAVAQSEGAVPRHQQRSDAEVLQDYAKRRGLDAKVLKTGLWLMDKTERGPHDKQ